ncbi:MAG: phage tail tape measure protein, partial [Lactiplantibacillus plantarum]
MADIAGSVKINVDLIAKEALEQAEVLKRTFKDVDVSPKAAANLKVLNQGLETTAASYSKLSAAQAQAGLHMSSQVSKLNSYKAQLQANRQEMTATAGEIGRLSRAEGDNSAQVVAAKSKYAALEREQQALVLSASKLQKGVGALTPEMAAAADKAMIMGTKIQNAGEKISSLGSKATIGFTVPIVTAMGAATKSFINFDSQIKSMGALLDDGHTSASKLKSELNSLGDASKKWSVQYGVSTTQINDGMTEMIKKGYSFQQVMGGMPSILNATKASGDDFNDVMKVSTSTLEQFGLKSNNTATMLKNTQRVTDGLTYVANKTSAGFTDMGYAMEYVGPVAHGLNMSLEETSAAIGLMSNQGIEGQKAGTSLRGALSALLTPSKQNMEGFKALGVSVSDFKKGTLTLPDILDNIKAKSKGMTKQQLQSNLALAFGTEAQSGMNILVNEGGDALRKLTSETQNSTGYTKKLADTMNDTAKANVDKFKQSLNVLGIEAGQHLLPLVTEFLKHAKELIERFNNLDPATQKLILNTGLAVA